MKNLDYSVATGVIHAIIDQLNKRQLGMLSGYLNSCVMAEEHIQEMFLEAFDKTLTEETCRNINQAVIKEIIPLGSHVLKDEQKEYIKNDRQIAKFVEWCRDCDHPIINNRFVVISAHGNFDNPVLFPDGVWVVVLKEQQESIQPAYQVRRVTSDGSCTLRYSSSKEACLEHARHARLELRQ